MSQPIKAKSSMKIDNAPTPHNTPASVLQSSYLKNGNPTKKSQEQELPTVLSEENLNKALAQQPLLLQSIQDKLGNLIGTDSGYLDKLPTSVKRRIMGLKGLQDEIFQLEQKFQIEMFELENKYLKLYEPIFNKRFNIINGSEEPTNDEIDKGKSMENKFALDEQNDEENEENEEDIKGIPSFWLTAFENLPVVNETITERDAEVLDYLTDIEMKYLTEGQPGFQLIFKFDSKQNPFFTNDELIKTYYYQSELGYSGDFIYDYAKGCKIDWTSNVNNVTLDVEMRKQRNKNTKQVRTIEKLTPIESFFNFFDPPKMNQPDHVADDEDEDEDDEDEGELEARLALDYSIGEQIKDKLIPRAIDWFTGAALDFEYINENDDEYFDENDDEFGEDAFDENEDEDDEDEDEDDFAQTKQEAPECKQS